ncbi:hypothetical protein C8A05DRAFT_45436 [Staphylotrichum tortipilum]|uniref:Protein kinase domain-containing protein n=1 Tax=Staphylotrichum tortipilum TaxID=2831512 RepID=A0AAN6MH74_9PEZI|nr:hypothetical protein C8A05DRAFT_45436 [Staphylotrichum longicolle]
MSSNLPPPRFWSPPPDPFKPPLPYQPGFTVPIARHTPPPPFGDRRHAPTNFHNLSAINLHTATQTEVVLASPPLEADTLTPPPPGETATLTVLSPIAVSDDRGAQIVLCRITPASGAPYRAAAKIFDPLYYPFAHPDASYVPQNIARLADVAYSHEAAAYEHLQHRPDLPVPKYFGAWTFELAVETPQGRRRRAVRVVVMEYVPGRSIREIAESRVLAGGFSVEERLEVLAGALEAAVVVRHSGVDQRDLAGRNVILRETTGRDKATGEKEALKHRVVLIDFDTAEVTSLTLRGAHPHELLPRPQNPMALFWHDSLPEFEGWKPAEWEYGGSSVRRGWLRERFGGRRGEEYEPVGELED